MANNYDYLIKLLLVGDSGVGKSSLLSRFVDDSFITSFTPTNGVVLKTRMIAMGQKRIKLQIWDAGGQERYPATSSYYRERMGILLVYDVTDESSFKNTRNWIRNIEQYASNNVNTILVGNKAGMDEGKRVVPTSKGQALADEYGIKFFETSAKTNLNVGEVFFLIARDIKWRLFESDSTPEIKQLEDWQGQKRNDDINVTKESLKKAKEEKEIIFYENKQLKQHISTLKKAKEEKENLSYENEQLTQQISILKKAKEEKENLSYENEQLKEHISTLKKAKKEKEILSYENEQLKQHISTLKKTKKEKKILSYENEQLSQQISTLKKAKEEEKDFHYENEQLKQHISTLKYDLELALLERDNVVKESEELRGQMKDELAQTSNFTWQELNESTLKSSESLIIGKGGYGCVYKGNLRGTDVAIKVLNSEKTTPLSAFKQEVAILTTFRHPNLVTLIGACYEYSVLVYEFLPNGSLEDHLSPTNNITPLTWQVRTRIMHEICLALIFLHSNKPNIVIHGDLKPDNVLLDANFVSKLGDFGISRLIEQSDNTARYETKNIVGTPGYIDPDFICNGQLAEKSDVFSFGVIILRLLTGQSAMGVVFRVEDAVQSETLDNMIDKSAGEWPLDQAKELAVLGLRCTEMKRKDRPNLFNEVWPIFEGLQRNI